MLTFKPSLVLKNMLNDDPVTAAEAEQARALANSEA